MPIERKDLKVKWFPNGLQKPYVQVTLHDGIIAQGNSEFEALNNAEKYIAKQLESLEAVPDATGDSTDLTLATKEILRLEAKVKELEDSSICRRWNIREVPEGLEICEGNHNKTESCRFRLYVLAV